jgi:hypothetical protein
MKKFFQTLFPWLSSLFGSPKKIDNPETQTEGQKPTDSQNGQLKNLKTVQEFIKGDFEKVGHDHAMTIDDENYKNLGISKIKQDFDVLISQVKLDYQRELDVINLRLEKSKLELLSKLRDEFEAKKKARENELQEVINIEKEHKVDKGLSQLMITNYKRGFAKGIESKLRGDLDKLN